MYYFDNTKNTALIEVVDLRQKNSESHSMEWSTSSTIGITDVKVDGTNTEVHSDDQDSFGTLKKDADKLLVHSTGLKKISGLCVCGERTKQVGCTAGNEGHHPSLSFGILTSIVLELDWIARIAEAQLTATELKKCRYLADSLDSAEFRYMTVEDCKVLYRIKGEGTHLVLPKYGGFIQLVLEELYSSKLAGNLGVRKTLSALQYRVWWPGMTQTVTKFVQACPICQRVKDSIQ